MSMDEEAVDSEIEFVDELKPGTQLMLGQYTIERFLAAGGFGITYLATDSLKRRLVIKECFPGSFCRRQDHSVVPRSRAHQEELKSIVRHFSKEALTLSKAGHPNIVGVHQVFEENNTAYMALDYVEGRDLLELLKEEPENLTPDRVQNYLSQMLDAIGHVHSKGLLHRDISPDNIIVSTDDEPVLIDFGAARETADKKASRLLSALRVVKDGYSPQEFYIVGSEQGPSCDLYSLAASFYHIITGDLPPDSQSRLTAFAAGEPDPYVSLADRTQNYPANFATALDKAMSILPKDRMQSAEEWVAHIEYGEQGTPEPVDAEKAGAANTNSVPMPLLVGGGAIVSIAGVALAYFATQPEQTDEVVAQLPPEASAFESTTSPSVSEADPDNPSPSEVVDVQTTDAEEAVEVEDTVSDETPVVADALPEALPQPSVETLADTLVAVPAPPSRPVFASGSSQDQVVLQDAPEPDSETGPVVETARSPNLQGGDAEAALEPTEPDEPEEQVQESLASSEEDETKSATDVQVDVARSVSGEELPPADDVPLVTTNWTVRLPFTHSESDPSKVEDVLLNAWSWLQPGTRIVSVNGIDVGGIPNIQAILRASTPLSDQTQLDLLLGVQQDGDSQVSEFPLVLPVVEVVVLENGLGIESTFRDGAWQSVVTSVPSGASTALREGDVLIEYLPTGNAINRRTSIYDAIVADDANALDEGLFRVMRGDEIVEASVFSDIPVDTPVPVLSENIRPQKRPEETASEPTANANIGVIEAVSVVEIDAPLIPFTLSTDEPGVVETVIDRAPFWLSPGVRIVSVDGVAVSDNASILNLLEQAVRNAGGEATVTIGTDARLSEAAIERRLSLESERQTILLNGLVFASADEDGEFVTRVKQAPDGSAFRTGDKVVAYMATGETLGSSITLKSILDRELAAGRTSFSFAVERQGEMWVEGFNLASLTD